MPWPARLIACWRRWRQKSPVFRAFTDGVAYTVTGNPVRRELLQARANCLRRRPGRCAAGVGGVGAQPINDVMPRVMHSLTRTAARY
jgi:hypothetical protein